MSHPLVRPQFVGLYKVWGGGRLAQAKSLSEENDRGEKLGEVLEVCDLENLQTLSLQERLSYLVKLIDTKSPLSVQVHPDDEYAGRYEKSTGKSECWYILEAKKDSKIYLGLRPGVGYKDIEQLLKAEGDLSKLMRCYSPRPGDFFTVPAGTIHAIGDGIILAEVQQPSGVTYRFWDWGRVGLDGRPRPLHLRQAFDVLNLEDEATFFKSGQASHEVLWESAGFRVKKVKVQANSKSIINLKRMSTIFALEMIDYEYDKTQEVLERWGSLFIQKDLELSLMAHKDGEVECLIIEPQE